MSPQRTIARSVPFVLGMLLAMPAVGHAQQPVSGSRGVAGEPSPPVGAASHGTPLGRRITVHESDITLRRALDRVAAAADVRLSYSSDLLPLERRVTFGFDDVPLGSALAALLDGIDVEPHIASANHVALVPRSSPWPADTVTEPVAAITLEPVRVETDRVAEAMAGRITASTVITGEQIAARPGASLAAMLNGAVPGLWLGGGSTGGTHYASVRGATSFLSNAPAVYIDGIELANPMLLTRLAPETIDRVELISGPQGAALHGANAMAGVLSITTRQHVEQDGRAHLRLQSSLGVGENPFAVGTAFTQEHGVGLAIGGGGRSARIDVSAASAGGLLSASSPHQLAADLAGGITSGHSRVGLTARLLFADISEYAVPAVRGRTSTPQSIGVVAPTALRQLTAGFTAATQPNARWTHSALFGIDAYALDRPAFMAPFVAQPLVATAAAERITVRLSSRGRIDVGSVGHVVLSLAAGHSRLSEQVGVRMVVLGSTAPVATDAAGPSAPITAPYDTSVAPSRIAANYVRVMGNTGLSVNTDITLRDRWVLRGGLRLDQYSGLLDVSRAVAQPVLGASWTEQAGPVGVTLRAAYGQAIRWPTLAPLQAIRGGLTVAPHELTPEQQTGFEAGIDLRIGDVLDVQLTRFDQTASSLMRPLDPVIRDPLNVPAARSAQDVGEIDNTGWELQATLRRGSLALSGTLGLVDSRVARTAADYTGELEAGDRMLNVPAVTTGLTASWNAGGWSAMLTAARASDWIGYDASPLLPQDVADPSLPVGLALREYWRAYDAVTLVGASLHRLLRPGLGITLTGDNLLDNRAGPPGDATIPSGRNFSLGLRLNF